MNPETALQNEIRLALSEHGGIVLRMQGGVFRTMDGRMISSGNPPGVPDLLYLGSGGVVAFIEVKTEHGRLSNAQKYFIEAMKKRGIRAGVARSVQDAIDITEREV